MTELKCEVCGKILRSLGSGLYTCDACHIMMPEVLWQDWHTLSNKIDRLTRCVNRCKNKFAVQPIHWEINRALKDLELIEQGQQPEDLN